MTTALISPTVEPIKAICDIIQHELGLDAAHVMASDQRYTPPTDDGMYVVVSYVDDKTIGNNSYMLGDVDDSGVGQEVQESAVNILAQIDVMSASSEARLRKQEIVMALAGIYARQVCDANLMQLARIPAGFRDMSALEGSSMLKRYTATIIIKALYRKVKETSYYDHNFTPAVHHDTRLPDDPTDA